MQLVHINSFQKANGVNKIRPVRAKSWIRTGFGRSYVKYRMGPDRIYGKLREITIFRYRDSAPLPVRMRNGRYISYFTHQLDYDKFINLFFSHLFTYLLLENDEFISHIKVSTLWNFTMISIDHEYHEVINLKNLQKIVISLP